MREFKFISYLKKKEKEKKDITKREKKRVNKLPLLLVVKVGKLTHVNSKLRSVNFYVKERFFLLNPYYVI